MPDISRLAQVRARLDLPVSRRAVGLLEGRHRSVLKGQGQDFDDLHLYQPGEDVGDIDWKSSARAGIPIVRRFIRESNLTMVIIADTGRSMSATAPSGEPKSDIAGFACALVAYLGRDRGDRVALVAGDSERIVQLPPRASTQDLEALLRTVERMWEPGAPASDLGRPLERTLNAFRRRSLLVLITDEARPGPEHSRLLRALRVRHELMVVAVGDLTPTALEAPSNRDVRDIDSEFALPAYLRGRAGLAQAVADEVARRRDAVAGVLRHHQIESVLVNSTDEVIPRFVELLGRQHAHR